ncbi:MAG: anthranilate phosphoribosyltransferase [Desulfovibrio sp.]|jgi:anthranilate synthase/phosphoribosyltransferase|nr:anthranilate phosphoribosyltransferase [Desulfovibrio sp.]
MFLLIDNYDSFTFNLVQAFYGLGLTPLVARNDDPALLGQAQNPALTGVCIAPGPGHPDDAGLCLDFLAALPPSVPVLGVCLGHQILGRFAGAPVVVGPRIVHGKASDILHDGQGLFQGLPCPLRAGRYHSLLVLADKAVTPLIVTARTAEDEVMALAFPDRPWVGVQFHPESVLTPDGINLLANFAAGCGQAALSGERPGPSPEIPVREGGESPTPYPLSTIIDTLARGEDLPPLMARAGFSRLMDGEMTPAQAGAFLLGLRAKGETPEEMSEAVSAILDRAVPVNIPPGIRVLDVVGTGGDGRFSFNCSTGTALTLAALGHRIVKHGNRSVSSQCGSADVLEGLGFDLDLSPEEVPARIEEDGFVFLFAPRFHPAFQHIMPIRRELGVRTLFNLMGPLVNPARPGLCFLGVARADLLPLVAGALARMGARSGAVIHGAGGYDELTTLGPAQVAFVRGGQVTLAALDPAEYGFSPCDPEDLMVRGPEQGTAVLRELLDGRGKESMLQMLALNTGFGLHLLRPEQPLAACMAEAKQAVAQGAGGAYVRTLLERNRARKKTSEARQSARPGAAA